MYQNIRFLDPSSPTPQQKSILPCTPLAVIKILEFLHIYNPILPYGNRLFGHTICVVNRSEVVGRPLAALLANDGATVYSVDITGVEKFTRGVGLRKRKHEVEEMQGWGMKDCAPLCDVVVTGVPGEKFKFDIDLLREGAVCVNFSSEKVRYMKSRSLLVLFSLYVGFTNELTHPQNFAPEVKEKASIYVPAIGKVTIAVLLRNLLRITQNRMLQEATKKVERGDTKTNEMPTTNGVIDKILNP